MFISALEITNFKSIGSDTQRFEFGPINLLFGDNGAGKSSVFYALGYLNEVFNNRNLDANQLSTAAEINLGGFKSFVFNRDINRVVKFKAEFSCDYFSELGMSENDKLYEKLISQGIYPGPINNTGIFGLLSLEISVAYSEKTNSIYIPKASLAVNKEHLWTIIESNNKEDEDNSIDFNFKHRLFTPHISKYTPGDYYLPKESVGLNAEGIRDILLSYNFNFHHSGISASELIMSDEHSYFDWILEQQQWDGSIDSDAPLSAYSRFIDLYTQKIISEIKLCIAQVCLVGPIRTIPNRYFEAKIPIQKQRWYTGHAAWDSFIDGAKEPESVNYWLDEKLKTGFRVFVEVDDFNTRVGLKNENNLRMASSELSVGISQIIPVITCAIYSPALVCIEQPELHIHPKLQVELADLFIESAIKPGISNYTRIAFDPVSSCYCMLPVNEKNISKFKTKNGIVNKVEGVKPEDFAPIMLEIQDVMDYVGHSEYLLGHFGFNDEDLSQFTAFDKCKKQIFLETHSEHIALRLLKRVRETDLHCPHNGIHLLPAQIKFIHMQKLSGQTVSTIVPLSSDGDFKAKWPGGFFDERDEELF